MDVMFRTLVVPLDRSQLAERAVPYAIRLSQQSAARLVLMQAVLAPPSASLDGADWERLQLDAIAEARTYLSSIADTLSGQVAAVEIATPYGRATDKILETIDTFQADGVVMATHGRTGLDHMLHGSVTEAILARSSVPVFTVYTRPGEAPPPAFSPANARLLVPQDGSDFDAAALRVALEMLGPRGEIILVTVVAPPEHIVSDYSGRRVVAYLDQQEEGLKRAAREYLADVAAPLRKDPMPISVKVDVRIGDPVNGIAMAAIDAQADLIVMATHARTGINRAVVGSVAGCVLRNACTPVVLVHPTSLATSDDAGITDPVAATEIGPVPTF
jgi:nucleotide-binding universal stress UspA family protein